MSGKGAQAELCGVAGGLFGDEGLSPMSILRSKPSSLKITLADSSLFWTHHDPGACWLWMALTTPSSP